MVVVVVATSATNRRHCSRRRPRPRLLLLFLPPGRLRRRARLRLLLGASRGSLPYGSYWDQDQLPRCAPKARRGRGGGLLGRILHPTFLLLPFLGTATPSPRLGIWSTGVVASTTAQTASRFGSTRRAVDGSVAVRGRLRRRSRRRLRRLRRRPRPRRAWVDAAADGRFPRVAPDVVTAQSAVASGDQCEASPPRGRGPPGVTDRASRTVHRLAAAVTRRGALPPGHGELSHRTLASAQPGCSVRRTPRWPRGAAGLSERVASLRRAAEAEREAREALVAKAKAAEGRVEAAEARRAAFESLAQSEAARLTQRLGLGTERTASVAQKHAALRPDGLHRRSWLSWRGGGRQHYARS